jgi:hypothetical protein
LGAGVGEVGLDAGSFKLDGVGALLDLGLAELAVGGEVDQAFFADVELGQLRGQGGVQLLGELLLLAHGLFELDTDRGGEIVSDPELGVVARDRQLGSRRR